MTDTVKQEDNLKQESFDSTVVDLELPHQSETVNDQTIDLENKLAEMKENWLRAVAENENLRKRAQREKEDMLKYASNNFAKDMLSVCDNLERALQNCPAKDNLTESVKSLINGLELTAQEMHSVFNRHQIKKIPSLGEKFDPHYHQAMFEIEDNNKEPGTVIQILQEGYMLHDRLLRPSMVGVSKVSNAKGDTESRVAQ